MKFYLKEMRVQHYIKNIIIFLPIFFNGSILDQTYLLALLVCFSAFSLLCSFIYVINDLVDLEKDKLHKEKCKRPIASGYLSVRQGKILANILLFLSLGLICMDVYLCNNFFILLPYMCYAVVNLLYSVFRWKEKPLFDILLLAVGFLLRLIIGSCITSIQISSWLYLVVFCGALYIGFSKRLMEYSEYSGDTRTVLKLYSKEYLSGHTLCCMILTIVFFSMWCLEKTQEENFNYLLFVPIVLFIFFRYNYISQTNKCGDPVEIIFYDKIIMSLSGIILIMMFVALYIL